MYTCITRYINSQPFLVDQQLLVDLRVRGFPKGTHLFYYYMSAYAVLTASPGSLESSPGAPCTPCLPYVNNKVIHTYTHMNIRMHVCMHVQVI